MNSDRFKSFISPHVLDVCDRLDVAAMSELPEGIVHFVAGAVYGIVLEARIPYATWRDEPLTHGAYVILNQEEIRRTLDFIRLRLETGSTTS